MQEMKDLATTLQGCFHSCMATLAQIATEAGVSEATVSRVLNSKPGVSEGTKQAVITALDVLGYERPAQLRQRSAGLVGLVVPELENPIFPAFAQVIEDALARRRFTPVLCTQSPGSLSEDEYVESLLDHGVAGIIFVSGKHADSRADHDRYRVLLERGLPVVFINGFVDGVDAPFISADDRVAMDLAVAHLFHLGHRRIGLAIGPARFMPSARKHEGFVAALGRHLGLPDHEARGWIAETIFSVEGGAAATDQLLAQGATAVVCGSDMMAIGAIRAARSRGLSVPGDVSVIGFDDSPLVAFLDPPLTTVRQPVAPMGSTAVAALADAIGGDPVASREYLFAPELVLRSSTGPAPA
jgi:alanine racemase